MCLRDYTVCCRIWLHLSDLSSEGKTIIITTHYIEEARRAHTVGMMRSGMILSEDAPESLMKCYGCSSLEDVFLKLCVIDTSKVIQVNNSFSRGVLTLTFNTRTNDFFVLFLATKCQAYAIQPFLFILRRKLTFIEVTPLFRKLLCPSTMAYKKNCYL